MAWELLPVDYTDAIWSGLKRYNEVTNDDGTVSFQDVTQYSNREKSFFGSKDANRMNEALNTIMSMVENGTDLYEAFQIYFDTQKKSFETEADAKQDDFDKYLATIKTGYSEEIKDYEAQQEAIFDAWFTAMKNKLSQDAAGALQNQCDELDERLSGIELMNIKNQFTAPLATDDSTDTDAILLADDNDVVLLADWMYKEV